MNEKPGITIPLKYLAGISLAGLISWIFIVRLVRWWSPW